MRNGQPDFNMTNIDEHDRSSSRYTENRFYRQGESDLAAKKETTNENELAIRSRSTKTRSLENEQDGGLPVRAPESDDFIPSSFSPARDRRECGGRRRNGPGR